MEWYGPEWNGLPEAEDYQGKVDMILFWSKFNEWFDTATLKGIAKHIPTGLSERQKESIDNMFSKTVIKQYIFDRKY